MPAKKGIKKVMVIGSGPIVIGQAAEFDYAGSQACRGLKEEGIEVVLVNSNPATIMTDANMAEHVYLEPLTPEFVTRILEREKPDGILPGLGGQVGLNIVKEIAQQGVLERLGVALLGTPIDAIEKAEDREKFKQMLEDINEPAPPSGICSTMEEALQLGESIGYPVIVRPAYTLGGSGGGIVQDPQQMRDVVARGLKYSIITQVLIEKCVSGWKEIEFEVMRDSADNCITICSMENIDPMGVHTGDSIVVAPALTLTDQEFQMLRTASLKIIRALGIEGGCNVQFAMDTQSFDYYVIEVNPRVSRSSALASKATGYPIAKVTSKIAIGLHLDEIRNAVTGKTWSCFEPTIDYCVVKFPRWPFDKFAKADRSLGTQMKATGEVMSLGRSFEEALLKAVRSLEIDLIHFELPELQGLSATALRSELSNPTDIRLFAVAEALRRGFSLEEIYDLTRIDFFFLHKFGHIIALERELEEAAPNGEPGRELLRKAKYYGFADQTIAQLMGREETEIRALRRKYGIKPVYKMVDTCAAEFAAATPYYYSTYETENEAIPSDRKKVTVLGSGPIRIGQGIEFDYCSVHASWALREEGVESIIINNNPETVSTDFDTSDRLYFEPLTPEDVLGILELEKPQGVVVQFGGQTAINLADALEKAAVPILGTTVKDIDAAEDRRRFDELMEDLGIPRPPGGTAFSVKQAEKIAKRIGYPALVRPSYVLGGRAMEIVYNIKDLREYMATAVKVSPNHPVLIDKYLKGIEMEVDGIADGYDCLIPGIMEHVEKAGVHSGDSLAVYPPVNLSPALQQKVVDHTMAMARALNIKGMFNIQYVYHEDELYVIEVNPRSSRTVPFLSKVTQIPMINLATKITLGKTLKELGYTGGLVPAPSFVSVKAPVFSFAKLLQLETSLGPEMKSTGEVMGINNSLPHALYKALLASGFDLPPSGTILVTVADKDKEEILPLMQKLANLGYHLMATRGTALYLEERGLQVERVNKIREGSPHVVDTILSGKVDLVINTLTRGKLPNSDGFRIRRASVEYNVPCLTSLDTALAAGEMLEKLKRGEDTGVRSLQEYLQQETPVRQ